jgi:hypothetical protein
LIQLLECVGVALSRILAWQQISNGQPRKNQPMNCKNRCVNALAAASCLIATSAVAAVPGFYVVTSLGLGVEDPRSAGANVGNSMVIFHVEADQIEVDDGKLAWSVGWGYRINSYLAAEVEYIDFGTTDVTEHYSVDNTALPFPFPLVFTVNYSSNVTGPALSLLGSLPVGENFELFLRGGALFGSRDYDNAGFGALDESFSRTVWLAGTGVTWSFAKRWALRAEYQQTGKLGESFVSGETSLRRIALSALFKL